MKIINMLLCIIVLQGCSPVEVLPPSSDEVVYNRIRFSVIDLVDVEKLSQKFNLIYFGTENNSHLLVALPLDKFSFNETGYFALPASDCTIANTFYPEQSLFYNYSEMETWKAITVVDGLCVVKEESQLRFLFD